MYQFRSLFSKYLLTQVHSHQACFISQQFTGFLMYFICGALELVTITDPYRLRYESYFVPGAPRPGAVFEYVLLFGLALQVSP